MTGLTFSNVSKKYKGATTFALKSVSWVAEQGEIIGLTGHNGAGKTTMLKILGGSVRPDSGTLTYNSSDNLLNRPELCRQLFAQMGQMHAPLRGVTPMQALTSIASTRGISRSLAKEKAVAFLQDVDLYSYAHTSSDQLSGGVQRLVAFGMALVQDAPFTLLDEPTNDVDPLRRQILWNIVKDEAANGRSFIISSHNLPEIAENASLMLVLKSGVLVYSGSPHEIPIRENVVIEVRFRNSIPHSVRSLGTVHDRQTLRINTDSHDIPRVLQMLGECVTNEQVISALIQAGPTFENLYARLHEETEFSNGKD